MAETENVSKKLETPSKGDSISKRKNRKKSARYLKYMCICHLAHSNNKQACNSLHRQYKERLHTLLSENKDGSATATLKTRVGFYRLPDQGTNGDVNSLRQACLVKMGVSEDQIKSKDAYIARHHFPTAAFEFNAKRNSYVLSKGVAKQLPSISFRIGAGDTDLPISSFKTQSEADYQSRLKVLEAKMDALIEQNKRILEILESGGPQTNDGGGAKKRKTSLLPTSFQM
mmetsp:Transcript_10865/g.12413  ORF Transcript_10865/g.12413 Transcript_10865/m.12413 type:complete len:229 (-) Transcript_10865:188-874(-)